MTVQACRGESPAGERLLLPAGTDLAEAPPADSTTYERLRQYYWPTDQEYLGPLGGDLYFTSNTEGRAFVDPDDLEKL